MRFCLTQNYVLASMPVKTLTTPWQRKVDQGSEVPRTTFMDSKVQDLVGNIRLPSSSKVPLGAVVGSSNSILGKVGTCGTYSCMYSSTPTTQHLSLAFLYVLIRCKSSRTTTTNFDYGLLCIHCCIIEYGLVNWGVRSLSEVAEPFLFSHYHDDLP